MAISPYPNWEPITLEHGKELLPAFQKCDTEVSEFTFANIYLFRETYSYQVASLGDGKFILQGERDGKRFFYLPWGVPDFGLLSELFEQFDYWKNLAGPLVEEYRDILEARDLALVPDRDNSDYLYSRDEMAELAGRKFHKKRNHVNYFKNHYDLPETKMLDAETAADAHKVLELWYEQKQEEGDMKASRDGIDYREELGLSGMVYYHGSRPIAYTMGEPLGNKMTYIIHFEKADHGIKGLYQYVNQHWAGMLSPSCTRINREQDLGEPGLRQAKMTYRPIGFVEKYRVKPLESLTEEDKIAMENSHIFSL
jgi:hypothetical protein